MKHFRSIVVTIAIIFIAASLTLAQSLPQLGKPVLGSFTGGPDVVNLSNLNVHWDFPIISKAGRGAPFVYEVPYDSTFWIPLFTGSSTVWQPLNANSFGWPTLAANNQGLPGAITFTTTTQTINNVVCVSQNPPQYTTLIVYKYSNWNYVDGQNTGHSFGNFYTVAFNQNCPTQNGNFGPMYGSAPSNDGLFKINVPASAAVNVFTNAGVNVTPGSGVTCGQNPSLQTDGNGNEISESCGVYKDTLGQTALTVSGGTSSPPVIFKQANATGTSTYTLAYSSYTVRTNFGCSGVSEFGPTAEKLPSTLTLADGRKYSFTYEATPGFTGDVTGRIASVTLPSGGTISYTYSGTNNGINCSDGTAMTVVRTTPDGTSTYARSVSSNSAVTTVTAPVYQGVQDQTVITFAGTASQYLEVARQSFSGTATSGTLLQSILTCYDSSASSCATTAGNALSMNVSSGVILPAQSGNPVRQTVQWPSNAGISSGTMDAYDGLGNNTSHVVYDYGAVGSGVPSTTALQTTNTTYANFYNSSTESNYPAEIKVLDSTGTTVSDVQYGYNQAAVTSTSGTPQKQTGLYPMNLTTVKTWVTGTTYLTATNTFYDTGLLNTATDANARVTTYSYGSASCGNSFPTSLSSQTGGSVVTSLSVSATWNCVGGVPLTSADLNANTTTFSYGSDPFWRPTTVTNNATGAATSYSYPTSSSNTSQASLNFNSGNSTSTSLTTYDGQGRTLLQQKLQSPTSSNYDTVAISYDSRGRLESTTLPYSGIAGNNVPSNPGTINTYDPLNRPIKTTDGGGGYTQYTYPTTFAGVSQPGYDVLVTIGPQVTTPASENLKKRTLEYNGASWLTSVCEVVTSTAPAGGACGQTTASTGYLTKYTYDGGRLIKTQQNAQTGSSGVQTRQLAYDGLGRKTSESIPEWSAGSGTVGTATYTYDTEASSCNTSSSGDLIKRIDSAGNIACFNYDLMHRLVSSKVVSGPYASVTPYTYAVYDAATKPGGGAASNVKGAVAEAYTCSVSCATKATDIIMSASPVTSGAASGGVLQQMWESTPHSGGYFLTQDTFFPNGGIQAVSATLNSATIGIPNLTYNSNGEGRMSSVTDSTHSLSLVTGATYNAVGTPLVVTFGNASTGSGNDTDSFTYDPNTNRPTVMTSKVMPTGSSFSITSNLTWNANGSLQKFQYVDGSSSPLSQTCNFQADDLRRIASVNCGNSIWAQNFAYDPLGNVNKTVPVSATGISYTAAYSPITNQVSSGISPLPSYDANGNQKTSTGATIAWNAENQPITINGTGGTYDPYGRLVETSSGSSYKQFVYRPSGSLLALFSGTLIKGLIRLPGGSTAIYNSAGLGYIRHSDWLGSNRLATTWAHAIYSKEAYAPFGETYNEQGTADRSFTGDDQNEVTGAGGSGVYDFFFRKYDPSSGRWLSPDPAGWAAVSESYPQSLNRYAYVRNNPLSYVDPDGTSDCDEEDCDGDGNTNNGDSDSGSSSNTVYAAGPSYQPGTIFQDTNGQLWMLQSDGTLIPYYIANAGELASCTAYCQQAFIPLSNYTAWTPGYGQTQGGPGGAPSSPNPQPQQVKAKVQGVCTNTILAGGVVVGVGGGLALFGTALDATIVGLPAGLLSQGSGVIAVAVGGAAIGIGSLGIGLGLCE